MLALFRVGVPVFSSAAGSHVNVVLFHLSTCPSAAPISLRSSAKIAPSSILAELTESSASSAVPTAPAVISSPTSVKAALVPPVIVRSEDVMSPVPLTAPTWVRTKALVAASCGAVGSAKSIILLLPKLTSAAAGPNPLKGILALSNLASVTFPFKMSPVLTSPSLIIPEVTELLASCGSPTAFSAIFGELMARSAMVTAPVLSMVASPPMATPEATLAALPTKIFPSFKVLAAPDTKST